MEEISYTRRSRQSTEEPLPFQARVETHIKAPMKLINDAHSELQDTYNNLHSIVNEVVSQNEWLLNSKL